MIATEQSTSGFVYKPRIALLKPDSTTFVLKPLLVRLSDTSQKSRAPVASITLYASLCSKIAGKYSQDHLTPRTVKHRPASSEADTPTLVHTSPDRLPLSPWHRTPLTGYRRQRNFRRIPDYNGLGIASEDTQPEPGIRFPLVILVFWDRAGDPFLTLEVYAVNLPKVKPPG